MNLRSVLIQASERANYETNADLRAQAEEVDHAELIRIVERLQTRAAVLAHACDVLTTGICLHPMEAFLHASECITNHDGSRLSDSEFYSLLGAWGRICEQAQKSA